MIDMLIQVLFYFLIINGVQRRVFHEMMTMNPSKLTSNEETVIKYT